MRDSFEWILADDGHRTWETLIRLTAHKNVVAIKLSRNCGHQVGRTAGFAKVGRARFKIHAAPQDRQDFEPKCFRKASSVYGQQSSRSWETKFKTWILRNFHQQLDRSTDVLIPACEVGSDGTASNELMLTWVK